MKNSVNLNSSEWCDMIFEGKNKSYGAFELRQSSWKRYIIAFGIMLLLVSLVAALPAIISTVKAATGTRAENVKDIYTVITVDQPLNKVEEVVKPTVPEPPKYMAMTKFVPPTITKDTEVPDDNPDMAIMDDVAKGNDAIGAFTVENGSKDADAIRKEIERDLGRGNGTKEAEDAPKTFVRAEVMPQFPGGDSEMYKFIADNLKYPVVDQEMGVQGRVTVRFVVSKTGEITSIELIKGISPTCDKEALRVIKSMPKWVPGKQSGNPVQVYFTMPIVFRLKS